LIENTAGAGRTVGRTAEEIAAMLRRVPAGLRARTGYGLDTCHLFASGIDFTSSAAAARAAIDHFCDVIGETPAFIHCNDSEGGFGSNRDRHALLGEGQVGLAPFGWLLSDDRLRRVPWFLETPQERADVLDDDVAADAYDTRMVALLKQLAGDTGAL
jgi:deoxyribonuclease-4